MTREQLEHVLRAASAIVGERDVLVIGSQAILGTIPDRDLPVEATTSIEADLAFFDDPADEKADQVDGAIGELSPFHEMYGYYAQGVSVTTAILPSGWRERLIILETSNTEPARGLCLEPHDCVVSKLVAGRWKDRDFAGALLRERLIDTDGPHRKNRSHEHFPRSESSTGQVGGRSSVGASGGNHETVIGFTAEVARKRLSADVTPLEAADAIGAARSQTDEVVAR